MFLNIGYFIDFFQVTASLMGELNKMYNMSDPSLEDKRSAEMESWLEYVYKNGDLNKDGLIDFDELAYLNKLSQEKEGKNEDEWKSIEEDDEYTEDEFKKFADEHSEYDDY